MSDEIKAATIELDLSQLAEALKLPDNVAIKGVRESEGYGRVIFKLEGSGLPDSCRVRVGCHVCRITPCYKTTFCQHETVEFEGFQ